MSWDLRTPRQSCRWGVGRGTRDVSTVVSDVSRWDHVGPAAVRSNDSTPSSLSTNEWSSLCLDSKRGAVVSGLSGIAVRRGPLGERGSLGTSRSSVVKDVPLLTWLPKCRCRRGMGVVR